MNQKITSVDPYSPAAKAGIKPGWILKNINNNSVYDVIDYEQLTAESILSVEIVDEFEETRLFHIKKDEYEALGLNFESSLMSPIRQCANHCIFCFIDQMPHGNRKTLYFKDDDWRLSLIMGNYVTLTNVSEIEFMRILKRRVAPLYISVHSTDGDVRKKMMNSKNADKILPMLQKLHQERLDFHCQIVLCPGYNDGEVLKKTLSDLYELTPSCRSVAIVPVGLTDHREGLVKLNPVTKQIALETISIVDSFKLSHSINDFAFLSDEMYLRAGVELPEYESCGEFEQIENGVGLYRKFEHEFVDALNEFEVQNELIEFESISGASISPFMQMLFDKLIDYNVKITVHTVYNDFFGRSITVTGLTTARDIISQKSGKINKPLLIPHTMLRENDVVFLDGMSLSELSSILHVPIFKISADDGYEFIDSIKEIIMNLGEKKK